MMANRELIAAEIMKMTEDYQKAYIADSDNLPSFKVQNVPWVI